MNEFQYDSTPQEQAMADLLKSQSHRLARQQIIFALIFLLIIVLAAYYIVTRMIWAIYDGYVTLDENHICAVDDIYILKVNKEVGEIVHKGDTLYSYVLLGNIVNQYDPNIIPSAVKETHDMEVQAKLAREEIPVLRTRLAELKKQKASESSDIYYGLTNNTKRNQLDAEIAEVEEEIRKQMNKVTIYSQAKNTTYNFMSRRGAGMVSADMPYSSNSSIYNHALIHYCCAPADAYVTKVNVSDKTLVFKSDEVLTIQHTDYAACHLGIITYVPSEKIKYMESPDDADVIVNNDLVLKAKLQMVGLRVEEIPKHLQSNFSHDANAVVAVFTFKPNQRVPAWVMSNKLPVRIRVNKISAMLDPKPLPMYTIPVDKNQNVMRSSKLVTPDQNKDNVKK
ncbi:multidrug transporter [Prevotella copri]|uniref:Multidrug transporter n=1 Tax=Segatella copri TaxID=165179 RepID=A0A6G1TXF6_9BACT|nr:multidrug transporter [Segatella copri]MQN79857.1 multidrug transporter [Segatella copri]